MFVVGPFNFQEMPKRKTPKKNDDQPELPLGQTPEAAERSQESGARSQKDGSQRPEAGEASQQVEMSGYRLPASGIWCACIFSIAIWARPDSRRW